MGNIFSDKIKHTNLGQFDNSRKIGTLAAILAATISCGTNEAGKDKSASLPSASERFIASQKHVYHEHKSSVYTGRNLIGDAGIADLEKSGSSFMPMPSRYGAEDLKEHLGEWTILQEGHLSDNSELSNNVLPYIDGAPGETRLYRPFAQIKENGISIAPRIYLRRGDPNFLGTLEQFAVYHTEVDAVRDINRVEETLKVRRDDPGSRNITLTPIQITNDLINKYAR